MFSDSHDNIYTLRSTCSHLDEADAESVSRLVQDADLEFIPPLSARSSTTQMQLANLLSDKRRSTEAYCAELKSQCFIFVDTADDSSSPHNRVAAFLSYRPNTVLLGRSSPLSHYVSTIIVSPAFRKRGLADAMYRELFTIALQHGQTVSTRTWSTNSGHIRLLEKHDFHLIKTLPHDRGEGIDTVYYERDAQK